MIPRYLVCYSERHLCHVTEDLFFLCICRVAALFAYRCRVVLTHLFPIVGVCGAFPPPPRGGGSGRVGLGGWGWGGHVGRFGGYMPPRPSVGPSQAPCLPLPSP